MKKAINLILIIMLSALFIFVISGCKSGEDSKDIETSTQEETETTQEEDAGDAEEAEKAEETAEEDTEDEEIAVEEDQQEEKAVQWSIDSNMGELLDNPQTRAILEKYIPEIVNSDRIDESRGHSLSLVLRFTDVEEGIPEKIDEELKNLGSDPDEVPEGVDETAIYTIKFEAAWSSETHPGYYEPSAHFSPFVIYSYNGADEGRIYILDSQASPGMEDMAETGATGKLIEEIEQFIEGNYALAYTKAKVFDSPGQVEGVLEFTPEFSQFIFVTMIAPSPDWFVAAEGDVFVDGQWIEELVLEVISYDAGTDSGETLTAANSDTDPKEPVTVFDDYLQGLGTLTVTRN
jgi:hypothetical protein